MTVCLKQYGEKRTGTNYLRALLIGNYPGVVPLMHILGDKHSPPVDLCLHWETVASTDDPAWEFVRSASFAAPAESTRPTDPAQLGYLREVAEVVTQSVRSNELGFILSTKHPYAWAASLARYSGWMIVQGGVAHMARHFRQHLSHACHQFNERHHAWLRHHRRCESRSIIVRHEDLVQDTLSVLRGLEAKFSLTRAQPEVMLVSGRVLPTDWDHCPASDRRARI